MKIAWVHSFAPVHRASGVFMFHLADEMRSRGCNIQLVYTGRLRGIATLLDFKRQLRLRTDDCHLIHAQYGSGCGYAASRLPGMRALTLRGTDWYGVERGTVRARLHGRIGRWLTRRCLTRYRLTLAVSERMKREIRTLFPTLDVEVFPSGIDLRKFRPIERGDARQQLRRGADGRPWVLFATINRSSAIKRTDLAQEAVRLAAERINGIQIQVLSDVAPDEMPLWINASNVVLLTSTHEGWPNIIKEALACNTPFVSTDVSDLAMIAKREPTCRVVPPCVTALADALVDVLKFPRPKTLRVHVEGMDLQICANRLLQIYDRLLGKGRPGPSVTA